MKRTLILFFIFITVACTKNAEQPENLVNEGKMAGIIAEIYLYQQSGYLQEIKNNQPDFGKIDASLIKKHGVEILDFEKSYQFYVLHPDLYNEIMIEVRDILERQLPEKERQKRIEERKQSEKKGK